MQMQGLRGIRGIRIWIKTTAVVLVQALLFSCTIPPFAEANLWSERQRALAEQQRRAELQERPWARLRQAAKELEAEEASLPGFPAIPAETGQIIQPEKSSYLGQSRLMQSSTAPLVIHIQDAHGYVTAQKNLAALLKTLAGSGAGSGPLLVGVEGAWKKVDLEWIHLFPNRGVRKAYADNALEQSSITGEEYLAILEGESLLEIEGVEDESLYRQNVDMKTKAEKIARQILQSRDPGALTLEQLALNLRSARGSAFPAPLAELARMREQFDAQKIGLAEYILRLRGLMGTPAWESRAQGSLRALAELSLNEASLDAAGIARERDRLIKILSGELDRGSLEWLARQSLEFRLGKISPHAYHRTLVKLAELNGAAVPELRRYVAYLEAADALKPESILEELRIVENEYSRSLCSTEEARALLAMDRWIGHQIKLWKLEFSPSDWKEYNRLAAELNWDSFKASYQKWDKRIGQAVPDKAWATFLKAVKKGQPDVERYFELAHRRDAVLVENAMKLAQARGRSRIVLIAGGFHSPGITHFLAERGARTVVVRPALGDARVTRRDDFFTKTLETAFTLRAMSESMKGSAARISSLVTLFALTRFQTGDPQELQKTLQDFVAALTQRYGRNEAERIARGARKIYFFSSSLVSSKDQFLLGVIEARQPIRFAVRVSNGRHQVFINEQIDSLENVRFRVDRGWLSDPNELKELSATAPNFFMDEGIWPGALQVEPDGTVRIRKFEPVKTLGDGPADLPAAPAAANSMNDPSVRTAALQAVSLKEKLGAVWNRAHTISHAAIQRLSPKLSRIFRSSPQTSGKSDKKKNSFFLTKVRILVITMIAAIGVFGFFSSFDNASAAEIYEENGQTRAIVEKGDSLWSIYEEYLTQRDGKAPDAAAIIDLMNANEANAPKIIYAGDKLTIVDPSRPAQPPVSPVAQATQNDAIQQPETLPNPIAPAAVPVTDIGIVDASPALPATEVLPPQDSGYQAAAAEATLEPEQFGPQTPAGVQNPQLFDEGPGKINRFFAKSMDTLARLGPWMGGLAILLMVVKNLVIGKIFASVFSKKKKAQIDAEEGGIAGGVSAADDAGPTPAPGSKPTVRQALSQLTFRNLSGFLTSGFELSTGEREHTPIRQWNARNLAGAIHGAILPSPAVEKMSSLFEIDTSGEPDNNVIVLVDLGTTNDQNAYQEMAMSLTNDGRIAAVIPRMRIETNHGKSFLTRWLLRPWIIMSTFALFLITSIPDYGIYIFAAFAVLAVLNLKSSLESLQAGEYFFTGRIRWLISTVKRNSRIGMIGSVSVDAKTSVEGLVKQRARWWGEIAKVLCDVTARRYPMYDAFGLEHDGWFHAKRKYAGYTDPQGGEGWLEDPSIPDWVKSYELGVNPMEMAYIEGGSAEILDIAQEGMVTEKDVWFGGKAIGVMCIVIQPDGALIVTPTGHKVHIIMTPRLTKGQKFNTALQLMQNRIGLELDGRRYTGGNITDFPSKSGARASFWTLYPAQLAEAEEKSRQFLQQQRRKALDAYQELSAAESTAEPAARDAVISLPQGSLGQKISPRRMSGIASRFTLGKIDWILYLRYRFFLGNVLGGRFQYTSLYAQYDDAGVRERVRAAMSEDRRRESPQLEARYRHYVSLYEAMLEQVGSRAELGRLLGVQRQFIGSEQGLITAIGLMSEAGESMALGNPLSRHLFTGNKRSHTLGDAIKPFGWVGQEEAAVYRGVKERFRDYNQDSTWLWGSHTALKEGPAAVESYLFGGAPSSLNAAQTQTLERLIRHAKSKAYRIESIVFRVSKSGILETAIVAPSAAFTDTRDGNIDWEKSGRDADEKSQYQERLSDLLGGFSAENARFAVYTPEEFSMILNPDKADAQKMTAAARKGVPGFTEQGVTPEVSREVSAMIRSNEAIVRIDPAEGYFHYALSERRAGSQNVLPFHRWAIARSDLEPTVDDLNGLYDRLSRRWLVELNARLKAEGKKTLSRRAVRTGRIAPGGADMKILLSLYGEPGQVVDFDDATRWHTVFGRIYDAPYIGTIRFPVIRPFFNRRPQVNALLARQRIAEGPQSSALGPSSLMIDYVGLVEDFKTGTKIGELAPIPPASGGIKEWTFEMTRRNTYPPVMEALHYLHFEGLQRSMRDMRENPLDADILKRLGIPELSENLLALSGASVLGERGKNSWGVIEHSFFSGTLQDPRRHVPGLFFHGTRAAYQEGLKYSAIPHFDLAVRLIRAYYGDFDGKTAVNPRLAASLAMTYPRAELAAELATLEAGRASAESRLDILARVPMDLDRKGALTAAIALLSGKASKPLTDFIASVSDWTPDHAKSLEGFLAAMQRAPPAHEDVNDTILAVFSRKDIRDFEAKDVFNLAARALDYRSQPDAKLSSNFSDIIRWNFLNLQLNTLKPEHSTVKKARRFFIDLFGWAVILYTGATFAYFLLVYPSSFLIMMNAVLSVPTVGLFAAWFIFSFITQFTPIATIAGYVAGSGAGSLAARIAMQIRKIGLQARLALAGWRLRSETNGIPNFISNVAPAARVETAAVDIQPDAGSVQRISEALNSRMAFGQMGYLQPPVERIEGHLVLVNKILAFRLAKVHGDFSTYDYQKVTGALSQALNRASKLLQTADNPLFEKSVRIAPAGKKADFYRQVANTDPSAALEIPIEMLSEKDVAKRAENLTLLSLLVAVASSRRPDLAGKDPIFTSAAHLGAFQRYFLEMSPPDRARALNALSRMENTLVVEEKKSFQPLHFLASAALLNDEKIALDAVTAVTLNRGMFTDPAHVEEINKYRDETAAPEQNKEPAIALQFKTSPARALTRVTLRLLRNPVFFLGFKRGLFTTAAIAVFAVAALAVQPWDIGSTMPYTDESLYATQVLVELSSTHFEWSNYNGGLPFLWPVMSSAAYAIGGVTASRFLIYFISLLTLVPIYKYSKLFAERLGHKDGKWVGLGSALIFGILPSTIMSSAFATYDRPAIFMLAMGLWMLESGFKTSKMKPYMLAAFFFVMGFAFKYTGVAFLPYAGLYAAWVAFYSNMGRHRIDDWMNPGSWAVWAKDSARDLLTSPAMRYFGYPMIGMMLALLAVFGHFFFDFLGLISNHGMSTREQVIRDFIQFFGVAAALSAAGIMASKRKLHALPPLLWSIVMILLMPKISFDKQLIYPATLSAPLFGLILAGGARGFFAKAKSSFRALIFLTAVGAILIMNTQLTHRLHNRWWTDERAAYEVVNSAIQPGDRLLTTAGTSMMTEIDQEQLHTLHLHSFQYTTYEGKQRVEGEQAEYNRIDSGYYNIILYDGNTFPLDRARMDEMLLGPDSKYEQIFYDGPTDVGVYRLKEQYRDIMPSRDRHATLLKNYEASAEQTINQVKVMVLSSMFGLGLLMAGAFVLRSRIRFGWLTVQSWFSDRKALERSAHLRLHETLRGAGVNPRSVTRKSWNEAVAGIASGQHAAHVGLKLAATGSSAAGQDSLERLQSGVQASWSQFTSHFRGKSYVHLHTVRWYRSTTAQLRQLVRELFGYVPRLRVNLRKSAMVSVVTATLFLACTIDSRGVTFSQGTNAQIPPNLSAASLIVDARNPAVLSGDRVNIFYEGAASSLISSMPMRLLRGGPDAGTLTLPVEKSWPDGVYRVDIMAGDTVIDSQYQILESEAPSVEQVGIYIPLELFESAPNIWDKGTSTLGQDIVRAVESTGRSVRYLDKESLQSLDPQKIKNVVIVGDIPAEAGLGLETYINEGGKLIQRRPESIALEAGDILAALGAPTVISSVKLTSAETATSADNAIVGVIADARSYASFKVPNKAAVYPEKSTYMQINGTRVDVPVRAEKNFVLYFQLRVDDGSQDGKVVVLHYNTHPRKPNSIEEFLFGRENVEFSNIFSQGKLDYVIFNLGDDYKSGRWTNLSRDLQADINTAYEEDYPILYIEQVQISGTLDVGDIAFSAPVPSEISDQLLEHLLNFEQSSKAVMAANRPVVEDPDTSVVTEIVPPVLIVPDPKTGASVSIAPGDPAHDVPGALQLVADADAAAFGLKSRLIKTPEALYPIQSGLAQEILISFVETGTLAAGTPARAPFRVIDLETGGIVWTGSLPAEGRFETTTGETVYPLSLGIAAEGRYALAVQINGSWYASRSFSVVNDPFAADADLLVNSFETRRSGNFPEFSRNVTYGSDSFAPGTRVQMPHTGFDEGNTWFFTSLRSKFIFQALFAARHLPMDSENAAPLLEEAQYDFDWLYAMQSHSGDMRGSVAELEANDELGYFQSLSEGTIGPRSIRGGGKDNFSTNTIADHSSAMGQYYAAFAEDGDDRALKALSSQIEGFHFIENYYKTHDQPAHWSPEKSNVPLGGHVSDVRDMDERVLMSAMILESYSRDPELFNKTAADLGLPIDIEAVSRFVAQNYSKLQVTNPSDNQTLNKDVPAAAVLAFMDETAARNLGLADVQMRAREDLVTNGSRLVAVAESNPNGLAASAEEQGRWGSNRNLAENGTALMIAHELYPLVNGGRTTPVYLESAIRLWTYLAQGTNENGMPFVVGKTGGPALVHDTITLAHPGASDGWIVLGPTSVGHPAGAPGTKSYVNDKTAPHDEIGTEVNTPAAILIASLREAARHYYAANSPALQDEIQGLPYAGGNIHLRDVAILGAGSITVGTASFIGQFMVGGTATLIGLAVAAIYSAGAALKLLALTSNRTTRLSVEQEVDSNNWVVRAHGLLHRRLDAPIFGRFRLGRHESVVHILDVPLAPALMLFELSGRLKSFRALPQFRSPAIHRWTWRAAQPVLAPFWTLVSHGLNGWTSRLPKYATDRAVAGLADEIRDLENVKEVRGRLMAGHSAITALLAGAAAFQIHSDSAAIFFAIDAALLSALFSAGFWKHYARHRVQAGLDDNRFARTHGFFGALTLGPKFWRNEVASRAAKAFLESSDPMPDDAVFPADDPSSDMAPDLGTALLAAADGMRAAQSNGHRANIDFLDTRGYARLDNGGLSASPIFIQQIDYLKKRALQRRAAGETAFISLMGEDRAALDSIVQEFQLDDLVSEELLFENDGTEAAVIIRRIQSSAAAQGSAAVNVFTSFIYESFWKSAQAEGIALLVMEKILDFGAGAVVRVPKAEWNAGFAVPEGFAGSWKEIDGMIEVQLNPVQTLDAGQVEDLWRAAKVIERQA